MRIKLSLKNKMQLFLISVSVVIYAIAIGYISVNAKKDAYKSSVTIVNSIAEKNALNIETDMAEYATVVRTLAQAFQVYPDMPQEQWDSLFVKMYDIVYNANPDFYKLWDSWELNQIDPEWNQPTGRIANIVSRNNGSLLKKQNIRSLDGDPPVYAFIKEQNKELVLPIYFDVFADNNEDVKLMTSLVTPIMIEGEYHGMVGIDLILEKFQEMVKKIDLKEFENDYSFLLTQEGKFAGHPQTELLNQLAEFKHENESILNISEKIQEGQPFDVMSIDSIGKKHFIAFAPIQVGKADTPWFLGVSVPLNSIMAQADRNFMISILVGFFGLIILGFVIYIITKNISDPIQDLTDYIKKLALGETDSKFDMNVKSGDEIEEMTDALRVSIEGLNLKTDFANNIESGNLDAEFDLLSENDLLGTALVNMRNSLRKARDEENNRKIEDDKRRWTNEGLAKFADILRQNNNDISELSDEIIKNLVYYLEANQGGLFILNEEDKKNIILDLTSAFAFDRKKHIQKQIPYGDGIVGSTAREKETTYLEDLPEDYITITSGLGDANPTSLLIVPLKLEDKVYGVIEIASFKKMEDYHIEFVEKVGQSIASTLSTVKINMETTELLEKFQQQSEEMSAQEEEMRQNMEELQATQEEASRKNNQMESLLHALDQSSCIVEYDIEGIITKVNDNYLDLLKMDRSEVLGLHHTEKMQFTEEQKDNYKKFWKDLKSGKSRKEKATYLVNGKEQIFVEVYTPIFNEDGSLNKVLKISNSITDFD